MLTNERIKNEETFNNFSRIDQELIKRLGVAVNKLIELHKKAKFYSSEPKNALNSLYKRDEEIDQRFSVNKDKESKELEMSASSKADMLFISLTLGLIDSSMEKLEDKIQAGNAHWRYHTHINVLLLNNPTIMHDTPEENLAAIKNREARVLRDFRKMFDSVGRMQVN